MELVLDNLNLAKHIANRHSRTGKMEFDDLFQEGCIGLIKAAELYKEGDVPFSKFSAMYIEWSIQDALRKNNLVTTNKTVVELAITISKKKLRDESVESIVKALGSKKELTKRALEYLNRNILSLDFEYTGANGDPLDSIYRYIGYEEEYGFETLKERLLELAPERCRKALGMNLDGYSNQEIADALGVGLGKARNILGEGKRAIKKHEEEFLYENRSN